MKTLIEKRFVLNYIKEVLNDLKTNECIIDDAIYHHNAGYGDASSICCYGILTLEDLKNLQIKDITDSELERLSDIESHINGTDAVSLSVVGLKDLYAGEEEYSPFSPKLVDFLISSNLLVGRSCNHYGNEFLSYRSISKKHLRSADIRLLELINKIENDNNEYIIEDIINKYNSLKNIANSILENDLCIPIREMSFDNKALDLEKIIKTPELVLVKRK